MPKKKWLFLWTLHVVNHKSNKKCVMMILWCTPTRGHFMLKLAKNQMKILETLLNLKEEISEFILDEFCEKSDDEIQNMKWDIARQFLCANNSMKKKQWFKNDTIWYKNYRQKLLQKRRNSSRGHDSIFNA